MTAAAYLAAAGAALYGPRWQAQLSRDLGVNIRTMSRWASGEWPLPSYRLEQVRQLLGQRANEIGSLAEPVTMARQGL